jgi:hypothetical protein
MKANQLATLVLRLMGIYCLIQFIMGATTSLPLVPALVVLGLERFNASEMIGLVTVLLFLAVQLTVGILLVVKSVPWGEKITPQNSAETAITPISFEQLHVLAFAVVGILIFAGAFAQLINNFLSFLLLHKIVSQIASQNQNLHDVASRWRILLTNFGTLLKAGLGLWMFFGAHGFANFWRSLKNFGTPKPPEN